MLCCVFCCFAVPTSMRANDTMAYVLKPLINTAEGVPSSSCCRGSINDNEFAELIALGSLGDGKDIDKQELAKHII